MNLSETSSVDKAVLEAMSCGAIVITSNTAFASMLASFAHDCFIDDPSPQRIAQALERIMVTPAAEREALGKSLRAVVVRDHSLGNFMERILSLPEMTKRAEINVPRSRQP